MLQQLYYNNEKKNEIIFTLTEKTSAELSAEDLLHQRAKARYGFKAEFYYERAEVDGALLEFCEKSQHVIITGKPLAGKSRAIFHFLKKIDNAIIFLPQEDNFNENLIPYLRAYSFQEHLKYFFVFNDINNFVSLIEDTSNKNFQFNKLISFLLEQDDIILLCSCQTSKLDYVESALMSNFSYFQQLSIPALTESDKKQIEITVINKKGLIPDDTIGSFFFPLDEMRLLYKKLVEFEQEILRSYKCVEIWHNNHQGNKQLVINYTEKRFQFYYAEPVFHFPPAKWDKALNHLTQQGFIQQSYERIYIEPAYLEYVIATEETEEKIAFEIVSYYADVFSYNKIIGRVSDNNLRQKLFLRMKQHAVKPDVVTFNILINKCADFIEAQRLFEAMQKVDIKADSFTFNSLFSKSGNMEQMQNVWQQMQQAKIQPDPITLLTLLRKNADYELLEMIFHTIPFSLRKNIKANIITILLGNAKNFKHAKGILKRIDIDTQANIITFSTLLNKTETFAQAQAVIQQMQDKGIQGNEITFNTFLNKAETFAQAQLVLKTMLALGFKADKFTYSTLMKKCSSFAEEWTLFEQMAAQNITADKYIYAQLASKVKTVEENNKILPYIIQHQVILKPAQYSALITPQTDFVTAWQIYQLIVKANIKPHHTVLNTLAQLVSNENQADLVFIELNSLNYWVSTQAFNQLIKNVTDFAKAWQIYQYMKTMNARFNTETFELLKTLSKYSSEDYWMFKNEYDNWQKSLKYNK
ncbi:MAG: hypothetical protein WAX77_16165 [Methylococcaceae bacterium]